MTGLVHLTGRVWIYPADPREERVQGCVAVITDPDGSIAVDAGNCPTVAADVQRAVADAALPAVRTLVYTHHHWDHVWGACAWSGVEIVGHAAGVALLEAEAQRPWSHVYLRSEMAANPLLGPSYAARARAMPTWDDFTVLPPHRIFADALALPSEVYLRHVGGNHAIDSLVVEVPDSKVLLLGDCFYPPPRHLGRPEDGLDRALLQRLLSDRFDWYVDSHTQPHARDEVETALGLR